MDNLYDSILTFWFPDDDYHSWWFIPKNNFDKIIYDNYYQIMLDKFNNFNIKDYENCNIKKIITDIIILDQFSRNINRIIGNLNIIEYTKKAYQLSKLWIDQKYYLLENIKYTVFAFLPIRHLRDITEISNILLILDTIQKLNPNIVNNKIYQKFKFFSEKSLCKVK